MDTKVVFIYTLAHPITKEVRYVGKTNNFHARALTHVSDVNKGKITHKTNWLKSLFNKGLYAEMELLDEVLESEWIFWERFWINQFKVWGFNLVNHTEGGDGLTMRNSGSFKKGHKPWNSGSKGIKIKPNKNVHQYNAITGVFIKTWDTAKQAGDALNINAQGIGQCANSRAKSAGGYIWKYEKFDTVSPVEYSGKTNNKVINKLKIN